ncbi:MAG: hypothetical protein MK212_11430 [Saprospiraceae bacterium]|nr:hypothetical protein [Saprospiraceae bacterium]
MDKFLEENPQHKYTAEINKSIFNNWKFLAEQHSATFTGKHNGLHADIKTKFQTSLGPASISISRALQSAAGTAVLPRIAEITTFTYITINTNYTSSKLIIRKANLINSLFSIFRFNLKSIESSRNYIVKSKKLKIGKEIVSHPFLKDVLNKDELVKLVVKPNKIKMTFKKVFIEIQEIEDLLRFIEDMNKVFATA